VPQPYPAPSRDSQTAFCGHLNRHRRSLRSRRADHHDPGALLARCLGNNSI
jgi:hypothetical protein